MDMKAKIHCNRIGEVDVYEMLGTLTGAASRQFLMETKTLLKNQAGRYSVLYNTQNLNSIDRNGAEAILENSRQALKSAVITRDTHTAELLLEEPSFHPIIFDKFDDAIQYLSQELAGAPESAPPERRMHGRLQVALPVWVSLPEMRSRDLSDSALCATNLSFNGMFAQFLDSGVENILRKSVNPFDSTALKFKIRFSKRDLITIKGKIVHVDLRHKGLGVEFYEMTEPVEWQLSQYLERLALPPDTSPDGDSGLIQRGKL